MSVLHVSSPSKAPKVEHWAIFTESTGFDGYDQPFSYISYDAYLDKEEWVKEVKRLTTCDYQRKPFLAAHITPATITTKVEVTVKVDQ